MNLPKLCLVDTNVPMIANLAAKSDSDQVPPKCVLACVKAIEQVRKTRGLVIDSEDEICEEYRRRLSSKGQPGVGDAFMKWVNDIRWQLPESQRVAITRQGDSYHEFPDHPKLHGFDYSDRKFIAVANAHPNQPPIIQATDSKWWGYKEALKEAGITVEFLCPDYIREKNQRKKKS